MNYVIPYHRDCRSIWHVSRDWSNVKAATTKVCKIKYRITVVVIMEPGGVVQVQWLVVDTI